MNDFELRFVLRRTDDRDVRILQFRKQSGYVDALTRQVVVKWSEWVDVPLVTETETHQSHAT